LITILRGLAAAVERAAKRKHKIISILDPAPLTKGAGLDKFVIIYYNSKSALKLGAPEFLLAG
jgi:hypothetical protein